MKNRLITFAIITGTFVLLSAGLTFRQEISVIPDLEGKMENYYRKYPQQKAYLHLDKLAYKAGEKIWYMGYLVDARTHKPDTISQNLLVELVNSYGNVSMIQMLNLKRGFAQGDFFIPDTLPEGLYQIRAYTNWMRNFGQEYYFRRDINIWNPGHYVNLYREDKLASKKHKRKSNRKAHKLDIQFFPEGGYLVEGVACRVGFKGINELGLGVSVSGKIVDSDDRILAEFESSHLGMGSFTFTPEMDIKYTAEVEGQDGKIHRFEFPEVQSSGYYLKLIGSDRKALKLQVGSTFESPTVLVACHIRGNLVFTSELVLGDDDTILEIPTEDFPGGILHITLFDSNREPRCERLTYIISENILNLSIRTDKSEYGAMEPVELTLFARDASGRPVEGRFSLAVSDRDLINNAPDFQSTITSSLLLSSDIAGRIEQPDYYFRNQNAVTLQALDYLMLTQGWRRFNWNDIIYETPREIEYPIQKGIIVRGKVTKEFLDIPLKSLPVTLTVLSEFNDVFIARSDEKGQFEFALPNYEDTIQVEITARRLNGRKNLVIYLEDSELDEHEKIYSSYASEMIVKGTNVLKPVKEREVDTMQQSMEGIYYSADNVLYLDEHMRSQNSVLDIIKGRIPGVTVTGDEVMIRGPSSIYLSSQPLFLIDNVPTTVDAVKALNPHDVERIEVLKGPSAAIYGSRGGNGVIAIFTKRGSYIIKGILKFEMLGYHRASEFYSPKYGTEFDDMVIDTRSSLYWDPEVVTDGTGTARIKFYNSDKISTFYVVAEGITMEGNVGRTERSYVVK
ncbi:TonB-dependent receptor plug domain-containing protein [Bacteroidota bacterium]